MQNNLDQLKVLAEVFNTDKIITSDQIEQVLTGILGLLARFKKENQSLNDDTKTQVESIIEGISKEHDRILASVEKSTQNVKSEATEAVEKALERLKEITKEVLSYKAKDGERGLDADEEIIVEKVLGKIVLPEYKETVLDGGEEIVSKINALDISEGNQIDASHIKNLPIGGIRGGSTARNLWQLNDVTLTDPTNDQVLKYDSTLKQWVNSTGGGGGGTPGGSNTQLQYNNAGAFGGISGATTNGTVVTLTAPVIATSQTNSYATASTIGIFDGSKNLISADTATYPSLTELSYVKGVTSAIQTQLNAKVDDGAVTTSGLTMATSRILGRTTASTGAIEELSTVDSFVSAASDTTAGKIEVATTAETNTGTDATRAVSPDALAGSYAGTKSVSIAVFAPTTDVATGDGKAYITIPEALNGMDLIRAQATVVTAGTTNATTVMIHNVTDAVDMLSGAISIASGGTVGTVGTINTSNDGVATNDILRVDVDSVSTTAPKGLMVILEFRLPVI